MTEQRFAEMLRYMRSAWPNRMDSWPPDVKNVWLKALEPYSDRVVDLAIRDLSKGRERNQEFPFSLTEIMSECERAQRYYRSQGYKL